MREKQKDNLHPGAILREELIDKNNLTLHQARKLLDISYTQLLYVINGRCDITPIMCLRLEAVFGEDPEKWAVMQAKYSVKMAAEEAAGDGKALNLKPYKPE